MKTRERAVLLLLFASVWLLYIDRGTLPVAAPALREDLKLNPREMGYLLAAFFWTYAFGLTVSGWLVDRFAVKRVFALGFTVWAVATAATGLAPSFAGVFLARAMLGIGQSVAFPSYSRILSATLPETRRGTANALIDVGTKAGPAVANLLGILVPLLGWRVFFVVVGVATMAWLGPWLRWGPELEPLEAKGAKGPGIGAILNKRQAWATFGGLFCFNYAFYFLLTWLPTYLVDERKFSQTMMSVFSALPFLVTAGVSVASGVLSDRWIAAGASVNRVRKSFLVSGLVVFALVLPGGTLRDPTAAMSLLILACIGMGIFTSNLWATTQTLAGPSAAGRWTGIQNGIGNMGGVVAPIVTGELVQRFGDFAHAFYACSGMLLASAVLYGFVVGRIEPVQWDSAE